MLKSKNTYRTVLLNCLAVCILLWNANYASSSQDMISLAAQSMGAGTGNTAPASAYNANTNQYFIVYSKNDGSCSNERLFGILVDAISGESTGTEVPISDCNVSIENPEVIFNPSMDEYLVFYKSIGIIGNKSYLYYSAIDASSLGVTTSPTQVIGDPIADPFRKLAITINEQSGFYALGFQKTNASYESSLTIKYLSASDKTMMGYETTLDKNSFAKGNLGVFGSNLIFNGSSLVCVFEARFTSGSEIWGSFINDVSGEIIDPFFLISPEGTTGYFNPDAIYVSESNEIITAFEDSSYFDPGNQFILSDKIWLKKINALTGEQIAEPVELHELPGSGNTEDKKLPKLSYSDLSKELLITYYGIRFAAGTDTYNLFLHRCELSDLSSITSSSISVASSVGPQVLLNNYAKPIRFTYNEVNNQFLITWIDESITEGNTQIWRYDNNPPKNVDLSQKIRNENLLVGTTFGTFSSEDPDPEDSNITYALISGTGDTDNNYFTVNGDKLVVNISPNYEEKSTLSILVKATDTNGASTESIFTLTINDIPEKPQNITLAEPLEITENTVEFTSIITAMDDDIGDTHSFNLVAGDSADNNTNFSIDGNTLKLENPLNFEDSSYQYIRIEAKDLSGNTYSKGFAIRVLDVNEPPDTVYVSPGSIPENNPDAFVTVMIKDPDEISNYTISLTSGEGGEDNKYFIPEDNKLLTNTEFDFEEKSEYNVRILIKEGDFTDTVQVIVKIDDVNDPPESIALSNNILIEGNSSGYKIGKVTTYDQDENDTHIFSVVEGDDLFFVDGDDSLVTKIPLVYNFQDETKNFYEITILSIDNNDASYRQNFTIEVVPVPDTERPEFGPYPNSDPFLIDVGEMDLSVVATDNEELDTAYFRHRTIRSTEDFVKDSTTLHWAGNKSFTITTTIDETYLDELGMEYYFEIWDAAGNVKETPLNYVYVKHESLLFEPTAKSYDGSAESYRIITNPYDLGSNKVSAVFSDYGPSNKENWRLFKYQNGQNIEIGTEGSSLLAPGNAYWFNKSASLKNSITLEKPEPLEYNRNQIKNIQLKQGWNLVGNPYPFTLDWENILAHNNGKINSEAVAFNKEYIILDTLAKFEGAFVYAENTTTIEIPVLGNPGSSRIAKVDESSFEWLVHFDLKSDQIQYRLSTIGMHKDAVESFDRFDTPLLPRFINYADLAFEHPEHHSGAFTKDISSVQKNHVWEFIASTSSPNKSFELSWTKPEFTGSDKLLILYDIQNNKAIDMSLISSYHINLEEPTAFKAIYGDKAFVDDVLSNINVQALNPYPNPFKSEVYLPVVLPLSNLDYEVSCSIFNLMGEQIYHQADQGIPHGVYDIIWEDKESFKKGIYIYSIKVRNKFLTREFHGRLVKD